MHTYTLRDNAKDAVLKTENLNKKYRHLHAISNLNMVISKGQSLGIIGPNGSGKTTFLSMITGITNPTSGSIYWFGEQPIHKAISKIGAIVENPAFYPYMSGQNNLELSAHIRKKGHNRINEVLEQVGLTQFKHYKYKTYSLGMKQRLAIASSLLHDPEVLILDEPTNGLDPMGIKNVRMIIKRIADAGKTIIMASHLLDEVEKICSHFAVLNKGELLQIGPISTIQQDSEIVEVDTEQPDISDILSQFKGIQSVVRENKYHIVTLRPGVKINDLNQFLVENNIVVTHLAKRKNTLEKTFIDVLKNTK